MRSTTYQNYSVITTLSPPYNDKIIIISLNGKEKIGIKGLPEYFWGLTPKDIFHGQRCKRDINNFDPDGEVLDWVLSKQRHPKKLFKWEKKEGGMRLSSQSLQDLRNKDKKNVTILEVAEFAHKFLKGT